MIYHLNNKNVKFETGKQYLISFRNGSSGNYKVLGLHNPNIGKPALKLRDLDHGWICYISVDDIEKMS